MTHKDSYSIFNVSIIAYPIIEYLFVAGLLWLGLIRVDVYHMILLIIFIAYLVLNLRKITFIKFIIIYLSSFLIGNYIILLLSSNK